MRLQPNKEPRLIDDIIEKHVKNIVKRNQTSDYFFLHFFKISQTDKTLGLETSPGLFFLFLLL